MEIYKSPKFTITIFILLAAVICLLIVFGFQHRTKYMTNLTEAVTGLSVGANVEFNGVQVGTVKRIRLDHKNPKVVKVLLSVDKMAPVTKGTVAMIAYDNDSKNHYIALRDEGNDLAPLVAAKDERYAMIPSVPSTRTNTSESLSEIAVSLRQFNDTFQQFMDKDAIESFRQLLYSLQVVMNMLAQNNQRLNTLIINTESASNKFDSLLSSGQVTLRTLQNQMLPSTYQLISEMQVLMSKMSTMMSEVSQNPAVMLRGRTAPKPGPGE